MISDYINAPGYTVHPTLEDIKDHPTTFKPGERVVITEKVDGKFMGVGIHSGFQHPEIFDRRVLLFSKDLAERGAVFKDTEANRAYNPYIKAALQLGLFPKISKLFQLNISKVEGMYILGELTSGHNRANMDFQCFDIYVIHKGAGYFIPPEMLHIICIRSDIRTVPVLYEGKWEPELVDYFIEDVSEGIVIRPQLERYDGNSRVILKALKGAPT